LVVLMTVVSGGAQLQENFYQSTCSNVESIVKLAVQRKLGQTLVTSPATLRLFFHDCFVEGCDASIMIASPRGDAEKDAPDNLSLAGDGFDTIIKAKQAVEAQCPGVVSCADVLTIAARDVVVLAGGPSFNVELGRRDGLISKASRVTNNLPSPNLNVNLLSWIFRKNGLSFIDMIALSGAHTLGFSHCNRFSNRLYNFSPSSPVDPSLNPAFARQLMQICPRNANPAIVVSMDPTSANAFDNSYYKTLVAGRGLLTSDQVLFTTSLSRPIVNQFANDSNAFRAAFAGAMVRLGRVGVKTGKQGEIRRDCTKFNSG